MAQKPETFDVLAHEDRVFKPSESVRQSARWTDPGIYRRAEEDPEAFWAQMAEDIDWHTRWSEICQWEAPWAKWFVGGKLNLSYNCIDRHINSWRKNKAAIIWEGEPGDHRVITYYDLYRQVNAAADMLRRRGVGKGDRVAIYMGMVPELAVAMLACARIGAPHTVIFGGFSPNSLRDRINDCQAKMLITCDGAWRRGQIVRLKDNADKALEETPSIEKCIVVNRTSDATEVDMEEGRDLWWHREMRRSENAFVEPEMVDSEHPLYILYTSGTTGKPKGLLHTTGGYLVGVHTTTKYVFDLKEDDTYWCAADIGWVTGHSYIVYGPLSNGATSVMYEGSPDFPEHDRLWTIAEKNNVTILYTAPTAIRAFMKWGTEHPEKHDLSSIRLLGSVGEPINPEAWIWYRKHIGGDQAPVMDTWWQTETGMHMITPLPGITDLKPGSATRPFPGISAEIVDSEGNELENGNGGLLVIKKPWPSMARTIWGDDQRYVDTYWSRFPGIYFTGDGARKDEDGYFWLLGRVDDVLNVSGHRIGTAEVESALVSHPLVAEAAVIGIHHEIKGQGIAAFVTIIGDENYKQENVEVLRQHVGNEIGPIAKPDRIYMTHDLPKTRSGKIMRRLLRDIADGKVMGDVTTLADPSVLESIKTQYEEQ